MVSPMSRYFIDAAHIVDSHIEITRGRTYLRVLRYEPGDSIILVTGRVRLSAVIIELKGQVNRHGGWLPVNGELMYGSISRHTQKLQNGYNNPKCVELGIHSIIPLNTSRTVVNLSEAKRFIKE